MNKLEISLKISDEIYCATYLTQFQKIKVIDSVISNGFVVRYNTNYYYDKVVKLSFNDNATILYNILKLGRSISKTII